MSHEIRTPLNAILGLIELMMRSEQDEEERLSQLSYMEFAGNHLKGLLTDVLDLERLDSGKAEPHLTSFAAHEFFRRVVNGFTNRAEATGNELILEVQESVPEFLLADIGWVTQMLNNLIANALKFTSDGEIRCEVSWLSDGLLIAVSDTGKGIAKEDLGRILEPFEQAGKSMVNVGNQGVGLGLAITKKLVDLHGGTLEVESKLGQGTTFRIQLSLKEGQAESKSDQLTQSESGKASIPSAPILIVDDNELNVLVAQRMVSNWGYAVVRDGILRQNFAVESNPFMVSPTFTCQQDGYQGTREWRQSNHSWNRIPIVGLTADAETRTRDRALDAGMDDVVVKPFNPPHLRSIIERYSAAFIAQDGK